MGGAPWTAFMVHLFVMILSTIARLIIVCPMIKMSIMQFVKGAIVPSVLVFIAALPIPLALHLSLPHSALISIVIMSIGILTAALATYSFGLSQSERIFIADRMHIFINKIRRKD